MNRRRVLLGIFPHPDDESYTAGGTMAKAVDAGIDVYVLAATRGERGQIRDPRLATPDRLGAVRAEELRAACAALGVHPPLFLDYPDGGLDALHLEQAVGAIVRVMRAVRADVVVTLGPDGVYGHPDHIALHKLVTPAFRSAGGGSRFPEEVFGPAHVPQRLFWVAYPRGHFRPVWEQLLTTDLAEGVRRINPDRLGVGEEEMHAVIDVREALPRKLAALRAHRTQIDGDDPLSLFPAGILDRILDTERFTLALGERPAGRLHDLFEGLP